MTQLLLDPDAGDVNGDGVIDLLLTSAWSAVSGGHSGRMFLISAFDRPR